MRSVSYLTQTLVTSDAVAQLLLEYAQILALNEVADTVTIPVLTDGGDVALFNLLIGPASQMISGPALDSDVDLQSATAIRVLSEKIARLSPRSVEPDGPGWDFEGFDT